MHGGSEMEEFLRLAGLQAVLLLCQSILYFGSEKFQRKPHNVYFAADRKIPFVPAWVFAYILWFPLIFLFPLALYYTDRAVYLRYISAIIADDVLSVLIYLLYPTSFSRPVPPDTWSGFVMKLVYRGSYRGLNCAPSLHCSQCYLVILAVSLCRGLPSAAGALAVLVSVLVVISTMYTKQHAVIDVVSALPVALLCWEIGRLFPAVSFAAFAAG